jgi:hypothetical protein
MRLAQSLAKAVVRLWAVTAAFVPVAPASCAASLR